MKGELDRLQRMYGELGDEHLLDLSRDKETLTSDAQLALDGELRRRGLRRSQPGRTSRMDDSEVEVSVSPHGEERPYGFGAGIAGVVPGAAPAIDQALEAGGEARAGMVRLIQFYDGLALSNACEALDQAGIAPAVEEIEGDSSMALPSSFQVWVDAGNEEEGKTILRTRLGLFPLPEADDISDADAVSEVTEGKIGTFETAEEAEQVRALLVAEGFNASLESAEEEDNDGVGWWTVKVQPEAYTTAMRFLERTMSMERRDS